MKNYRNQPSCFDCAKVFAKEDYDSEDELFCNKANDRPVPCGSVMMHEWSREECYNKDSKIAEDWQRKIDVFEAWAEEHRVSNRGICDDYVNRKEIGNAER